MKLRIKQLPPIYGWAATAAFSGTGAYLSTNSYIAITALAAVAAYATGLFYETRRRTARRTQQREIAMARRSRDVVLVIISRAGYRHSRTFEQMLTDVTPGGCQFVWDTPAYAALLYADHNGGEDSGACASPGRRSESPVHDRGAEVTHHKLPRSLGTDERP